MTIDTKDMLNSILESISRISYIKHEEIPEIDLYMDQVTTFMESHLSSSRRHEGDKILTKTMINNYAKNNLLPPPVKKKYSKEHLLMLTFIYYLKNILCINDIQTLLDPISQNYFSGDGSMDMTELYNEIMNLELKQIEPLAKDVTKKYKLACSSFEHATEEEQDFLRKFSFICMLSFDVYVKKQVIEKIIDDMADNQPKETKNKNKNSKK